MYAVLQLKLSVHIRSMYHGFLRVSPLRRVPFVKQPQKEPKRPCPSVRPSLRSGSLAPVPLRGHAVTGHPWPNTALPASMPGGPLRRTSSQPPEGASRSRSKTNQKQIKSRSKTDQKRPCSRCFAFCFLLLKTRPLPPLDSRNDAHAHHRRPNAGAVVGVARQDAEPAVPGHGWPVTACPHNSAGVRVPGEPGRARPYGRAQTFWFLLGRLPKGTRRKGEIYISVKRL